MDRKSGVLLHPTSLPGNWPIGTLGNELSDFLDHLAESGVSLWQLLPLGPPGFGNSPYQAYSAFAGNPLLIDPWKIAEEGWLNKKEIEHWEAGSDKVDFSAARNMITRLLEISFRHFQADGGRSTSVYREFINQNRHWIFDYAIYMVFKENFDNSEWTAWPLKFREPPDHKEEYIDQTPRSEYFLFVQYVFYTQWNAIRRYASERDIEIIGDVPIFVSADSADVWANRSLFKLERSGKPRVVAGVPPDYFSMEGQMWGNPVYKWNVHRKDGYKWWISRLKTTLKQVDFVRLDHFRGFEQYWEVPAKAETARTGRWVKGPGDHFFASVAGELGELPFIAEDLGIITPAVTALRKKFGFPGMKILQFAFDSGPENPYLPHHYSRNYVVFTGTHDNDTTEGWYEKLASGGDSDRGGEIRSYLGYTPDSISRALIRLALQSIASWAIIPVQDILGLGGDARMNFPGTAEGNWNWRLTGYNMLKTGLQDLRNMISLYGRN